jgi:hypothetical protein
MHPRGVGITAWSPPRGVAGCNKKCKNVNDTRQNELEWDLACFACICKSSASSSPTTYQVVSNDEISFVNLSCALDALDLPVNVRDSNRRNEIHQGILNVMKIELNAAALRFTAVKASFIVTRNYTHSQDTNVLEIDLTNFICKCSSMIPSQRA